MRKKQFYKNRKLRKADPKYNSLILGRFINYLMKDGKKSIATTIIYKALEIVKGKIKKDPIEIFEQAIENVSPMYEVVFKRVGGAGYQVPKEVRPERKFFLACHWIIKAARNKKGRSMVDRLADEILAAYNNEGEAIKKKYEIHRVAEANRAFSHLARR